MSNPVALNEAEVGAVREMMREARTYEGTCAGLMLRGCSFGYAEYPAEFVNEYIRFPQRILTACTLPLYRRRSRDDKATYAMVAALVGAPQYQDPTKEPRWWRFEVATTWVWPIA
jgi:hypothetical protein